MPKLNITHVVPYFVPAWAYGGIPRLAYELAREQARMGHHVAVITTDAMDARSRHPESGRTVSMEDGRMCVRYLRNLSNRHAYDHQLFLPFGLGKALDELAADSNVIHIHGHRHILEVAAARFAAARGIPYVITANGSAPRIERKAAIKGALDAIALDKVLRSANAVIAVCREEIKQYTDRGVTRDKIHIIPNGLDVEAFDNLPRAGAFRAEWSLDDSPIVLYLGKITPRKGLVHLARALNIIRQNRKIRLVIAGNDMGYLPQVRREIMDLDMSGITLFTGLLRGMSKRAAYVDANVTVYPSEYEIFGLVPFESILCGTPVVVSDDCGCGEIIGEANIGETVPYGQPDKLAQAIEGVIDRPEESTGRVERGKAFIRENLAWPKIAADTVELYGKPARVSGEETSE